MIPKGDGVISFAGLSFSCPWLGWLSLAFRFLGTIRVNRVEVPQELKEKRRPVLSTRFAHDHDNKIVLASYIPKRNKVVILLSSSILPALPTAT